MPHTILLAEDDKITQKLMSTLLVGKLGYQIIAVDNGKQAVAELNKQNHDTFSAILLDINMPHMDGFEVLEFVRARYAHIPTIMLTGDTKAETVVKAIKLGAYDYINKPVDAAHLEVTLKNAIRMHDMAAELARIKRNHGSHLHFSDMVGFDLGLAPCIDIGTKAARTESPVMISGETGTGKELFARAIHGESSRAGRPFVAINCGAIPEKLIESILFGHEKGAFTGATEKTLGKFREADGGTIFLDELGDLPLDAQVKLLRVLQEHEVEPVGAAVPIKIDVRVISATNRNLEQQVKDSSFREDLFFRLNVLPVTLPALRERKDDIPLLAEYFLSQAALEDTTALKRLSSDARVYLTECSWPGNIRELANLMRRASIWCNDSEIDDSDLRALNTNNEMVMPATHASSPSRDTLLLKHNDGSYKTMEQIEKEVMQTVLSLENSNITHTADKLGIAKSTFYRKMQQFNSN